MSRKDVLLRRTKKNTIWQCTLNLTSFRTKARPAKRWELSSQGTEISPQNCQIEVQRPRLATKDKERDRDRDRGISLYLSFSKEEFSQYQKLWDSLYYREKVDKCGTKPVLTSFEIDFRLKMLVGRCKIDVYKKRKRLG